MDEGQRRADGDGGKARRRMFIGRAMNNQQEAAGQDNFNDDSRQHGEAARGVFAIAVEAKPLAAASKPALPLATTYSTAAAIIPPTT